MKEKISIKTYDKDEFIKEISQTIENFLQEKGKLRPKCPVLNNEKEEFIGQIIDIFEDFLDEKGIIIPNEERDSNEDIEPEEHANIFGEDYDILHFELSNVLSRWNIIEED